MSGRFGSGSGRLYRGDIADPDHYHLSNYYGNPHSRADIDSQPDTGTVANP
jgi:hypothetical protein